MTTSSRIVVGVDGSPASVDALRWAARQAELTGSTLEAVTSWHYPTQYGNEYYGETNWPELSQDILATAVTQAGTGTPLPCTRTVTEGHPAQVLVAASAGADLLVVGSRGHGGFAGMLLGSVSDYVIAHADCPVLVIRQPHQTSRLREDLDAVVADPARQPAAIRSGETTS
jgi:nucleotide-binding universal stress UspA family protein